VNRSRQVPRVILASISLLLFQSVDGAHASADVRATYETEEVRVLASRLKLDELRAAMVETEDQFYEQLNKLLDDPEMRVTCSVGPPLGTHIQHRACGPQFIATANATYARAMISELTSQGLMTGGRSYADPPPPGASIGSSEIVFRRTVSGLVQNNPALRELAKRREKLQVLFKAAQKAHFK